MTSTKIFMPLAALALTGLAAQAATFTGTVHNKTTGKPSAGDTVVLVDVQAGMSEAAHATTDANGKYTLTTTGNGSYLVRASHQGATYFIAAPQSGPGDINIYDAAPKVDGVGISADVIEYETGQGQVFVNERFFIHNNSNPQRTQAGGKGFEVVLPADAVVDGGSATRPTSSMPTNVQPVASGQKGHYTISLPIQPNAGEKETLIDLRYHMPYKGKLETSAHEEMAADNVAVLMPKSMSFAAGAGADFKQVQEDPGVLTYVAKNVAAGQTLNFTVSGEGQMPRENQTQSADGQQASGAQDNAGMGNQPGGGLGAPNTNSDPLSKYLWWILAALGLGLVIAAAFLLRKPAATAEGAPAAAPAAGGVLGALKEELFELESAKLAGTISEAEYNEAKQALEIVLKRALKR